MKILISPAKKLNINNKNNCLVKSTKPSFLEKSQNIINILKKLSSEEISKLMNISKDLSQLNYNRNQSWNTSSSDKNANQAILYFQGAVYESMEIDKFNSEDFDFANNNLRILSGLYGILKPSDMIMPYRLEMGTKIKINEHSNLYSFWKNSVTDNFINDSINDKSIINLASNEYYKVIDSKKLSTPVITPVFKDVKKGKLKVISFYAKKARGSMCNFIIKNKITDYNDLKNFNGLGYSFSNSESSKTLFTFTRSH